MWSPRHQEYQNSVAEWFRKHARDPGVAEELESHKAALLVVWNLDLEPARPFLDECYAANPRGGKPRDSVTTLRSLTLSLLKEQTSLNKWVPQYRGSRVLKVLTGLAEGDPGPGVGTFYDMLDRLHDGKKNCAGGVESASGLEKRRAKTPRPKKRKERAANPNTARGRRTVRRAEEREKKNEAERQAEVRNETVTARIVEELKAAEELPAAVDVTTRLALILLTVAVEPSAQKGLLGKLTALDFNGDGSPLPTGASPFGKKVCGHSRFEKCDCERIYSDPDAAWGYDNHRKVWFFGHHLYEIGVSIEGHDLPLFIRLDPGNESDYCASLKALDSCRKLLRERHPDWKVATYTADAGHDADAIYRYLQGAGIAPVILNRDNFPAEYPGRPDIKLSRRGVPLCTGNVEMAHRSTCSDGKQVFYCPVRAGLLKACPLAPNGDPDWRCCPDTNWGPTVTIDAFEHPRLSGLIPRNTAKWKKRYNARSGCERRNSGKKVGFDLVEARHRRASYWLIRLYVMAILQHAKAWVAGTDAGELVDRLLGRSENLALAA